MAVSETPSAPPVVASEQAAGQRSLVRVLQGRPTHWILPGAIFAAFVVSISYRVTPGHGVLMYGDYPYYWPSRANDGFSVLQSSFLGNIRFVAPSTSLLTPLPRLLSILLPATWTSYLLTYGLVYVACLTYYFVASRLTGSRLLGYVAGLFVILNSAVLQHLLYMPSNIFAALIVYALTFHLLIAAPRRPGARPAIAVGLLSLGITHPFLWILDLLLVCALFLYRRVQGAPVLRTALGSLALIVLLASYWLIPSAIGSLSFTTSSIFAGNQEPVFQGLRTAFQHVQAFSLLQYGGDSGNSVYNGSFPYFFYFAVTAFVVGVFVLSGRHGPRRQLYLFLLTLYVVLLSLGLGPNSPITGRAWLFANDHVPAFGFFRSFSRFTSLAVVVLVLLVVTAFDQLRRNRCRYYGLSVGVFLAVLVGSQFVFFTGDLNGTISASEVPSEYAALNADVLDGPTDYSVLTYPNVAYEGYRWSANRNVKAFPQITYFKELYLAQPVIFNRLALNNLGLDNDMLMRLLAYDSSFEFYPSFNDDVDKLDVRYILVHKDVFDNLRVSRDPSLFRNNGQAHRAGLVDSRRYRAHFSADSQYRLVEDNDAFTLYENRDFRPRVRSVGTSFQKLNDTTYRVHLSELRGERGISLLQRFDPGWRVYTLPYRSGSWCREISRYDDGLTECAKGGGGPDVGAVTRLVTGKELAAPHTETLGYANQWSIDASAIRDRFPQRYYSANPNGTIDVELLLYFQPQSYFYLGLVITALTVGACLVALSRPRLAQAWLAARKLLAS